MYGRLTVDVCEYWKCSQLCVLIGGHIRKRKNGGFKSLTRKKMGSNRCRRLLLGAKKKKGGGKSYTARQGSEQYQDNQFRKTARMPKRARGKESNVSRDG